MIRKLKFCVIADPARVHDMMRAAEAMRHHDTMRSPDFMRMPADMMRSPEGLRPEMMRSHELPPGPPPQEMTRSVTFVDEPKIRRHDEVPRRAVSFSMDQPEPVRKEPPMNHILNNSIPPPLPSTSPPREISVPPPPERNSSYVVMAQQGQVVHEYKEESPHRSSYYEGDSNDSYHQNEDPSVSYLYFTIPAGNRLKIYLLF
jgi:hypothetical protein